MSAVLHPATHEPLRLLQGRHTTTRARAAQRVAPLPAPPRAAAPATTAAHAGWLDRLAAWADRQPPHHRLGSLDALRQR